MGIAEAENKVYACLDQLGIRYSRFEHPAVFTVAEAAQYDDRIPGVHCKNIFIRNKNGKYHYLIIMPAEKVLDLKRLALLLNSSPFHLASVRRMEQYLGVSPGAVGPFGLLNDRQHEVIGVIDQSLKNAPLLKFHPNVNTASITLSYSDLLKFIQFCGNTLHIMEV